MTRTSPAGDFDSERHRTRIFAAAPARSAHRRHDPPSVRRRAHGTQRRRRGRVLRTRRPVRRRDRALGDDAGAALTRAGAGNQCHRRRSALRRRQLRRRDGDHHHPPVERPGGRPAGDATGQPQPGRHPDLRCCRARGVLATRVRARGDRHRAAAVSRHRAHRPRTRRQHGCTRRSDPARRNPGGCSRIQPRSNAVSTSLRPICPAVSGTDDTAGSGSRANASAPCGSSSRGRIRAAGRPDDLPDRHTQQGYPTTGNRRTPRVVRPDNSSAARIPCSASAAPGPSAAWE